jgi:hypothetical protein
LSEFGSEVPEESGKPKVGRKKGKGRRKSSVVTLAMNSSKKLDWDVTSVSVAEGEKVEGGTLGAYW